LNKALVVVPVLFMAHALLPGCTTTAPSADASQITLPASFQEVWYRPTLDRPGVAVMTDTGTVTVGAESVDFRGSTDAKRISYTDMQKVSFGKVGSDFINNWVTIKYRDGQNESYVLLTGGAAFGWGGRGVADRMFQSIRRALDQKGLASVIEDGRPIHDTAPAVAAAAAPEATATTVAVPPAPATPRTAASPAPPATIRAAAMPTTSVSSSSVFPRQGDTWTYRFAAPGSADGKPRHYSVLVAGVTETAIFERFHLEDGTGGDWAHGRGGYVVPLGVSLFSPYLAVFEKLSPAAALGRIDVKDENCRWPFTCEAAARVVGPETVKVGAGTFETIKVIVDQTWRSASIYQGPSPSRRLEIWYAPAVKRAVKFSSRPTFDRPPIDANFDLELVSYRLQ
jgi:hypothetical protein